MKTIQTIQQVQINLKKHQNFLKKFNRFPDKTRKIIYCQLMQIPLNYDHLTQLTKQYPLLPQHTLDQHVSFIVGVIGRLYPDLSNQWLPGIIYPFVKLFKEDNIASFQISLTFITNWFKPFLIDYPNPSKDIMKLFGKYLEKLENKINKLQYPLSSIINPMFLVSLTDILNKNDWLEIFDFIIAHPYSPWYLICIAIQIVSSIQNILISYNNIDQIALTLRKQKNLKIKQIINKAIKLSKVQNQYLKQLYNNIYFPLPKGRYPIIKFIPTKRQINKLIDKIQNKQIQQINSKFNYLEQLINTKIKNNISIDQKDINLRYQEIDGQMRQYLNKIKQQHSRKLQAIKDIQRSFKEKILQQGLYDYREAREAVERRGRLQQEIEVVRKQADSLRAIQLDLMSRIQDSASIKKKQLLRKNNELRRQQQSF